MEKNQNATGTTDRPARSETVARDLETIREFKARHGDIILKPLYGNGGAGVTVEITDIEFLGSFHRCHVKPTDVDGKAFLIDLSASRARALAIKEGVTVQAALPPEFVRIYRPAAGA